MPNRENNASRGGNIWNRVGKLGNIVFATKMFLNFLGNIFGSWEANFVSATMFPEVGKQRNIDRKHNVFATIAQGFRQSRYKILEQFYSQTLVGIQVGNCRNCFVIVLKIVLKFSRNCFALKTTTLLSINHKLSDTKFNEILFD